MVLVVLWGAAAAEVSVCPDPSERMITVWIFFGSEEGGTGAGGGTDAVAGGATAGGGAAGTGAIGATAPDPRALGGGVGLGEIGAVFFGGS